MIAYVLEEHVTSKEKIDADTTLMKTKVNVVGETVTISADIDTVCLLLHHVYFNDANNDIFEDHDNFEGHL